jgi:hypothetical protein
MSPGPTPKDRSTRRRRNVPSGGEWIDLLPLEKPVLQELGDDDEWSTRARETWQAWREDPATSQWSPADIAFASDTLTLVELNEREPRSSLAAEIRLRLDGLGLTPKGRRNLRWRLADAEVVEHPASSSTNARRRRLRAVESNKPGGSAA